MKLSTTTRTVFYLFALVLAQVSNLAAQRDYDLVIADPASIAGTYLAVPFTSFGTADFCGGAEFSGELALVNDGTGTTSDGCEANGSNVAGKIALVDRGTCNFSVKALNAQTAGAIGVVICQNIADPPFAGAAGAGADQVTIPVFMISKADCDLIKTQVSTGVDVELNPSASPEVPAEFNVLWGDDPGEGDFTDSLDQWTVTNISSCGFNLWQWDEDGLVAGGAFGSIALNSSPSGCDGAAYFYSDQYDNGGDPNNQGGGPCPSPQEGELISDPIDISSFNDVAGLSLVFYQTVRHFTNSRYFVGWSTDGGSTWTEVEINQDLVVNASPTDDFVKLPMPGVTNSDELLIKFRYVGSYYYWMVDDVKLIEQEAHNLRVNANFFAVPPNAQFPVGQQDPIYFLADIENIGALEQTGVSVNVTITNDANGQVVFSEDLSFDDIPGNTLVENSLFDEVFVPNLPVGQYTGVYTVSADDTDFDPTNNTQTFHFWVTQQTFAKEFGPTRVLTPAGNNWSDSEPHNWAIGNAFYIEGSPDLTATSISFSIANADSVAGKGLQVALYYWTDTNGDGQADPDERTELGTELYGILGNETDSTLITVPFGENTPEPPVLDLDGYYLAMIEWVDDDATADFWIQASDAIDYGAMLYTTDSIEAPRYASVVAIDESLTDEVYGLSSPLTFGADLVPVVRLNVSLESSTTTPLPAENIVEVYPNPASSVATLKVDFVNAQAKVNVRVMDALGKLALERTFQNVQKSLLPLDASRLAPGTYSIHVVSEDGVRTAKLVVSK